MIRNRQQLAETVKKSKKLKMAEKKSIICTVALMNLIKELCSMGVDRSSAQAMSALLHMLLIPGKSDVYR